MASTEPFLAVRGLNAFYGRAHVLHDVEFQMAREPVAVIGRNGMGKTTLCMSIMGMLSSVNGSIRFEGEELLGRSSYKIAGAGIGYVPQGRRLFSSLTVDEHFRMLAPSKEGPWTIKAVYELFPRLAERKGIGGNQLSGGEQQMLAIARALLQNPKLLLMDEPSEGLAPTVVEALVATCKELVAEGMALLLVEQTLDVATALCERQLVMVGGEIAAETTGKELEADPELQQQYLGVTRLEARA